MRSDINRNGSLGIQNARKSAKQIVRRDSDRPSMFALVCAPMAYASQSFARLQASLRHLPTATPWTSTRVTGGVSVAHATAGSGQHASSEMCCLAAS
jgi:hypothetical protein